MQALLDFLNAIANVVWSAITAIFGRFLSEPSYRDGFLAGMLTVFVVGGLSYLIGYAWARINNFFSATKAPPRAGSGPTPISMAFGCAGGALILFVLALTGILMLAGLSP
jgi:hypothetical protein